MEPRPPVAAVIQQCQPGIGQRRLVMALALFRFYDHQRAGGERAELCQPCRHCQPLAAAIGRVGEKQAGGITIDGIRYGEISARLDRQMPSNAWLNIAIREGKNLSLIHI